MCKNCKTERQKKGNSNPVFLAKRQTNLLLCVEKLVNENETSSKTMTIVYRDSMKLLVYTNNQVFTEEVIGYKGRVREMVDYVYEVEKLKKSGIKIYKKMCVCASN